MKNKNFIFAIGIVALFFALFVVLKGEFKTPSTDTSAGQDTAQFRVTPADPSTLIKPHSVVKGAFDSKITLVEFLDPECESCAAMYPVVKEIVKEFEKDIKIVVRYMPYHQNSKYVANILEGARAQSKYWETLELLFATQDQWANHHNPRPDLIPQILKPLGLDLDKILTEAKAGKYDSLIMEDMEDGKKLGVNGTPTFFVNGHMLEELGYEPLRNAIKSKLD